MFRYRRSTQLQPGLPHSWSGRFGSIACLAALSFSVPAEEGDGERPRQTVADKSQYTLFHPTPRNQMRPLSADRPDKTDTPFTVDAGHFQLEMDFLNLTHNEPDSSHGKARATQVEVAPFNLKMGLFNDLDFQFVASPWRWEKEANSSSPGSRSRSGFDGITPRFKLNLIGNDGGPFALALLPYVTIPLSQNHLGPDSVEGGLGIPMSVDVEHWEIGFQSTFRCLADEEGRKHHAEFANSISIGHHLVGKFNSYLEFYGSVSTERHKDWIGTIDTWLTYPLSENWRLDGGVYIGVTPAADDWHPWIGMTWRF